MRHLIVFVDDKSRTSPQTIFDRWEGKMTVEVVNLGQRDGGDNGDWEYDPNILAPVPDAIKNQTDVRRYLARQHMFYEDCLKAYKLDLDWPGWVAIVDADEFVSINRFTKIPSHPFYAGKSANLPTIKEPASILKRIRQVTAGNGTSSKAVQVKPFVVKVKLGEGSEGVRR